MIAALGLADQLVGVSHECDFPPSVRHVPVMVEPLVTGKEASSSDIDRQVKALVANGQPLYRLDGEAFQRAQPDVILTQALCHVCAVTPDQLSHAMSSLPYRPNIVTLSPTSLADILADVERIADAVHQADKGQALAGSLFQRLETVREQTGTRMSRPRVVCLEWLAPLYVAGHWVPEMVEWAGGQNVLGSRDSPSHETSWQDVAAARPDIILIMPCGYPIDRTVDELACPGQEQAGWMSALSRWPQTYVVDAASYFSRPGPRLVDGVELLASIFHPDPDTQLDPMKAARLEHALFAKGLRS